MTVCLWKRFSLLLVTALTLIALGCSKKAAPAPPPPPPPPPAPAPTITLTVDRASITAGQGVVLSYTATNATSVTINPGIGPVQPATSGTRPITPTQTTSFTAQALGPGGSATSAAVNVVVNQPAAAPPPPPPPPAAGNRGAAVAAAAAPTIDQLFTTTMTPIFFDYDKATIRTSEESKLLNIASWLKQNPTLRFTIEGHADERGGQEYNVALSDERAASVKKYLAGQGIAESRMNTIPYGEERPFCRETTEDCYQKNRRAAFTRIP